MNKNKKEIISDLRYITIFLHIYFTIFGVIALWFSFMQDKIITQIMIALGMMWFNVIVYEKFTNIKRGIKDE